MSKVAITGNTYPVKEQLKALGGRWDADKKAWVVPAEKADEARKIVAAAPEKSSSSTPSKRRFKTCADCGAPSQGYYRCRDCNLERREGGSRYRGGMSYTTRDGRFVLGDED